MCGRYSLVFDGEQLVSRFKLEPSLFPLPPRYHAAPSQKLPVVLDEAPTKLQLGYWGLVPSWEQGKAKPRAFINARSETIAVKPTFKRAAEARRCLVLADGFFEWDHAGTTKKQPYRIALKDGGPFAFAGIWEHWKGTPTYTIITVPADDLVARIHDRMPAMFLPDSAAAWLDRKLPLPDALAMLRPFPAGELTMYPVTPKVNSARYEGPDAVEPVD